MAVRKLPPGPPAPFLRGLLPQFRRDPLTLLTRIAREHGDIARVPLGPWDFILLNHPDLIEQVLVIQHDKFVKGRGLDGNTRIVGKGLLTSEGDFWRRQRRLAQPAFHRARVAAYGETMVEYARRQIAPWRDGETRDLAREMTRLTLAIAAKTLFNSDAEGEADRVGEALAVSMKLSTRRIRSLISIPLFIPTPSNARYERAARELDAVIYRIIDERRRSGEDAGDLLSMLMRAVDDDGSRMTPRQLRDEAMTIFLAGHETTANAMAWTWYLLSQHPRVEATLHEELDRALGGRPPSVEDLPALPYTDAVVWESMRLYPPAWILGRKSIAPFEVGGYRFPANTQVLMSQWVMHRDPRYFEDPGEFRPERWLDGLARRLPAFAYFPFGGGPRLCIGRGFALMEAALLLATIAQRFRFRLVPGHPVVPQPLITLRPKYGIQMTVHERSPAGVR